MSLNIRGSYRIHITIQAIVQGDFLAWEVCDMDDLNPVKNDSQSGKTDITLRDVIAHMNAIHSSIRTEMKAIERRLTTRIDGLASRMDGLEMTVDRIDHRLILVETKIDNMADTLNGIERIPFIGKEMQKQWKR